MSVRLEIAAGLLACVCARPGRADTLLLKNCQLLDPEARTVSTRDLLLTDGRISFLDAGTPAKATETLDLTGKWVIPGLVDVHVHAAGNALPDGEEIELTVHQAAQAMLYAGVTAFLDLANSDPAGMFGERDRQRAGDPTVQDEADVYAAGVPFGVWSLHGSKRARRDVRAYLEKWKPDVLKLIYQRMSAEPPDVAAFAAAIETARQAKVKTVIHIGPWEYAANALRAGASAITHFDDGHPIPDSLVRLWREKQAVSIPTMAVQGDLAAFVDKPTLLDSPLLESLVGPKAIATYRDPSRFSDKTKHWLDWQRDDAANDRRTFQKLHEAGILFLAGSDTNNLGTFQGFSLHREMKLLEEAGLSPWDALAAGTTRADAFLGRPSGAHSGERAELVVLEGDPIADLANTQRIFAVFHHGRRVDRQALLDALKVGQR